MSEAQGEGSHELSTEQRSMLEGFVGHFTEDSNRTIQHAGYYDLVAANFRERFNKFGLPMKTPEEYYPVMAGLSIATEWIKGLVGQGMAIEEAVEVIQDGFARLAPPGCVPVDGQ